MSKGRRSTPEPPPRPKDGRIEVSGLGMKAKLSGGGLTVVLLSLVIALFAILALIIALVK